MDFAKRFAHLRRQRGDSYHGMASVLGVHFTTVGLWERGECHPRVEHFDGILRYFGLTAAQFYGFKVPDGKLDSKPGPRRRARMRGVAATEARRG